MNNLITFLNKNESWAKNKLAAKPDFFTELAKGQSPEYLWIGCADSRVSPVTLSDMDQGDIFVTRNVANLVNHSDLSMLSVLRYAILVLTSIQNNDNHIINNWLCPIKNTYNANKDALNKIDDLQQRANLLSEFNIKDQVKNLSHIDTIQTAWTDNQSLEIHGVIFNLSTGLLEDLDCSISSIKQVDDAYKLNI